MTTDLKASGIGRTADDSRTLLLAFNRTPTDDEMRLIHDTARAVLRHGVDPNIPEPVYKAVERILDDHSAWIARPSDDVTRAVALQAVVATHTIMSKQQEAEAALAQQPVAKPGEDAELREDAERWRALMASGHVSMLGWAGFGTKTSGPDERGYRHMGVNFWSTRGTDTPGTAEIIQRETAIAKQKLIEYTDVIRAAQRTATERSDDV